MTMTVAQAVEHLFDNTALRVGAYDGSMSGPEDGWPTRIASERGLNYLLTAPGSLGLARAYLQDELVFEGVDEGDPYDLLVALEDGLVPRGPQWRGIPELARFAAAHRWRLPQLPPEETPSRARRLASGLAHGRRRDARAIAHHYDVSNRFYELVLGPLMAYTCAAYPSADATLEQAQEAKFDLVCRKLGLEPGMRLLDVGCGWGGMVRHAVRHYGVSALGVTLSREQATYAAARLDREGLGPRAQIRHQDYRDVAEDGFDAVSSIGLTEHIGPRNYPAYFRFLRSRLVDGGRLLNHCITRHDNGHDAVPERGVHQPLRLPRRWTDRIGRHRHRGRERRAGGAPPREPPRALWADLPRLVRQPVRELGGVRRRGRAGDGPGVGALPGRLPAVVRAQPDPVAPGVVRAHVGGRAQRLRARDALPAHPVRGQARCGPGTSGGPGP